MIFAHWRWQGSTDCHAVAVLPYCRLQYGYTALHYASACGHFKAVDMLLKAGANATQRTQVRHLPPLHVISRG